jgi:hypothetical protein
MIAEANEKDQEFASGSKLKNKLVVNQGDRLQMVRNEEEE